MTQGAAYGIYNCWMFVGCESSITDYGGCELCSITTLIECGGSCKTSPWSEKKFTSLIRTSANEKKPTSIMALLTLLSLAVSWVMETRGGIIGSLFCRCGFLVFGVGVLYYWCRGHGFELSV